MFVAGQLWFVFLCLHSIVLSERTAPVKDNVHLIEKEKLSLKIYIDSETVYSEMTHSIGQIKSFDNF